MRNNVSEFLKKYNQHPDQINIGELSDAFISEMEKGLNGEASTIKMIPTYLGVKDSVVYDTPVIAIDAGGTNLRIGVVTITKDGVKVENVKKQKMLGVESELTKQEFLDQFTDLIYPYLQYSTKIGFCFSFPAEILPNKDGKVLYFTKEIKLDECNGMILGKELNENIKSRGFESDVQFVILNDTVSTLLGGPTITGEKEFDGQIGLILGTGTNTAYIEQGKKISKIDTNEEYMIINTESGGFGKIKQGYFDEVVDSHSPIKGQQIFEKMISGVYLGNVICEAAKQAKRDGLLSDSCTILELENVGMSKVDSFLRAPYGDNEIAKTCVNKEDADIIYEIADAIIDRASKLVTVNLASCIRKMDGGKIASRPARIVAEGSTILKCFSYMDKIDYFMKQYVNYELGKYYEFTTGEDVNMIGSALAALANL